MLHHPMATLTLSRMLTFFSQFDFTLHYVSSTSNVVADALSRSNRITPSTDPLLASMPRVYDCESQRVVRDTTLRRHGLHSTVLCSISRQDEELLVDLHDLRGINGVLSVRWCKSDLTSTGSGSSPAHRSRGIKCASLPCDGEIVQGRLRA